MKINAWRIPWKGKMVPHAVVDILRGCNISCRACYNLGETKKQKPLSLIEQELDIMLSFRRLDSVTVLGGEITLFSQLIDVIKMIKGKGLKIELLTNGLNVGYQECLEYKKAGVDIIYFHIEKGQIRPDLKNNELIEDINKLRKKKAAAASKAGLDVGLTVTVFPDEFDEIRSAVELTIKVPEINYLLVTLYRDHSNIKFLKGDLINGFFAEGLPPDPKTVQCNNHIAEWLKNNMNIEPFGVVCSNLDKSDPRWLSYLIASVYHEGGKCEYDYMKASLLEKLVMFIYRLAGHYPMYMKQDRIMFRKQIMLNGFLGGRMLSNMKILRKTKSINTGLKAKRILFQNPAEITSDGRLIHCECCPDAVIKNGKMVPVCISDNVS